MSAEVRHGIRFSVAQNTPDFPTKRCMHLQDYPGSTPLKGIFPYGFHEMGTGVALGALTLSRARRTFIV